MKSSTTAKKTELLWRARAWKDLTHFAKAIPIPGVPQDWDDDGDIPLIKTEFSEHHIIILEALQAVAEGTLYDETGSACKRVMIFTPPGSAKSTLASVVFPAWYMGKYPDKPIILTGYASQICVKHGKRARQVCSSDEYKAIFGASLDPTTKAADNWALTNGSSYLSNGIQAGLTGNRAAGLIIDDPVRGRQDAESRTQQMSTWDAYKDDARSRKIPSAFEAIIQTRWHQEDLAGKILPKEWSGESGFIKCMDGHTWYVICIQAEAEHESDPLGRKPGEYMWTDWFNTEGDPEAYWAPLKLDTRSWGSLYQQIPTPPEGTFFKESWVLRYDHLPKELNIYMSGDYAVTRDEDADDPDFTSLGIWGMDSEGQVYFLDGWHGKVDAAEWTDIALDFVENRKPLAHVAGGGPIRRGTEPWFRRRMVERKAYVRLVWFPETHGKEENCRTFQAMMQAGMVHWPRGNEEAEWVIRHLIGFGTLRYDDAVDMCGMFGRHVDKLWEAKRPKQVEGKPVIKPGAIPIQNLMPKKMRQQMRKRS